MNHRYTRAQIRFIRKTYRKFSEKQLLIKFNRRFRLKLRIGQLASFITNHRIRSGRNGRFEKGHVPANAGTKGLMKANSGSFAKGNIPANIKPLGSERIDSRDGYIIIKVAEKDPYTNAWTRYRQKHVVIWEKAHGPIPPGKAIIFKDGNIQHCSLKNLECVTRAELLRLNQHRYKTCPAKIKKSVLALARLEVKTEALISPREKYRLRRCNSLRICIVCRHKIRIGGKYFDGFNGKFAHMECFEKLAAPPNPKHRLFLMMVYGCGLRVGEAVSIRVGDLNLDSGMLYLHGKGKKDRVVSVKEIPQELLKAQVFGKAQGQYVFEAQGTRDHICKRTASKILEHACQAAGVVTRCNIHKLRHSFATHLIDQGESLPTVQAILGHASAKTTEIYIHVSQAMIGKTKSPLAKVIGGQ